MNLVPNYHIDKKKWDECVINAINAKPYGLSSWLDAVAPKWEGIIIGDYDAVMPIFIKRVLWIKKIAQPLFTQQLGLFFKQQNDLRHLSDIVKYLKGNFNRGYLQLNETNFHEELNFNSRRNYKLRLSELNTDSYSKSHLRNLKKARKSNLELIELDPTSFQIGYAKHNPIYRSQIKRHRNTFLNLINTTADLGIGRAISVRNSNNTIAAVWFVVYNKTAYYMLPYTSNEGRELGAMHFLISELTSILPEVEILDFEGSELDGVERFILGFDAKLYPYPVLSW